MEAAGGHVLSGLGFEGVGVGGYGGELVSQEAVLVDLLSFEGGQLGVAGGIGLGRTDHLESTIFPPAVGVLGVGLDFGHIWVGTS